jgi:hypothetical protein
VSRVPVPSFDQPPGAPEDIAQTPLVVAPGYPTRFRRLRIQNAKVPRYFLAGAVMLDEITYRAYTDHEIVGIAQNLASIDHALRHRTGVPVVSLGEGRLLAGRSVAKRGLYLTVPDSGERGEMVAHIPLGGMLDAHYNQDADDPEIEVRHSGEAHEVSVARFLVPYRLLSPRNQRSARELIRDFTHAGVLVVGERGVPAFLTEATSDERAQGDPPARREHAVASRAAEVLGAHGFPMPRAKVLA